MTRQHTPATPLHRSSSESLRRQLLIDPSSPVGEPVPEVVHFLSVCAAVFSAEVVGPDVLTQHWPALKISLSGILQQESCGVAVGQQRLIRPWAGAVGGGEVCLRS